MGCVHNIALNTACFCAKLHRINDVGGGWRSRPFWCLEMMVSKFVSVTCSANVVKVGNSTAINTNNYTHATEIGDC